MSKNKRNRKHEQDKYTRKYKKEDEVRGIIPKKRRKKRTNEYLQELEEN